MQVLADGPRALVGDGRIMVTRNRNPVYEIPTDVFDGATTGELRHDRVLVFIGDGPKSQ